MQRYDFDQLNNQPEKRPNENSTKEIFTSLGVGGPPKKPLTVGKGVQLYNTNEEIKIDKDGHPYIGISIQELIKLETQQNKAPNITHASETSDGTIFTLSPSKK